MSGDALDWTPEMAIDAARAAMGKYPADKVVIVLLNDELTPTGVRYFQAGCNHWELMGLLADTQAILAKNRFENTTQEDETDYMQDHIDHCDSKVLWHCRFTTHMSSNVELPSWHPDYGKADKIPPHVSPHRPRQKKSAKAIVENKDKLSPPKHLPAPRLFLPAYDGEYPDEATRTKLEFFAREYLRDYNATMAAVRMGYTQNSASQLAHKMFNHPYTQAYFNKLIQQLDQNSIVSRNDVLAALWREANSYSMDSTGASRVAALSKCMMVLGMHIQRVEISARSSGVMQVPMVADINEWENVAASSQKHLLDAARL